MARGSFPSLSRSKGVFGVALAALLLIVVSGVILLMMAEEVERSLAKTEATKTSIDAVKSIVLDYARKNGSLPSVSQFNALTSTVKDSWGNSFFYFPATSLTTGISGVSNTPISVLSCFSDKSCATYLRTDNVSFVIVSPGEVIYNSSSPIAQTTQLTSSTQISTQTYFRTYSASLEVGPIEDSSASSKARKYDDKLIFGTLPDAYQAAATLSKTKGDVLDSGGDLKILNSSPLPGGTCGVAYSKSLSAYGMDTGAFSWSITGLPTGLTAASSATKSTTISGTPTEDGTFSVVAAITDPNSRQASKTFSLTIVSPGWSDTGSTRNSSCSTGMLGSIPEKEQTNSCGLSQWVSNGTSTCVNTSTSDTRFRGSTLISAGASSSSTNTGQASLSVGAGTAQFTITATSSTGASTNISREAAASTSSAIGVVGSTGPTYMNPGESLIFTLNGGAARTIGIEFYGLGVNTTGTDKIEEAIVTMTNTLTGTTVATYTLSGCQTDSNTIRSTFFLPDPGSEFNQVKVTAGTSPTNTDFMIRSFRVCGSGTSCTPTGATATTCPYP